MLDNVRLLVPAQRVPAGPVMPVGAVGRVEGVNPGAPEAPVTPAGAVPEEFGVILEFAPKDAPKSGNYAPDGLNVEDSRRIAAEKARGKQGNEPCKTCAERKYQDGSADAGVSFKSPTSVSPEAAASAVMAHEQEHVSIAHAEGREKNMNVHTSVSIHTSICPECKKIYVAGGTTYTRMTPKSEAIDAYAKQMELSKGA